MWVYEFRLSVVAARSVRLHVWASAFCILEAAGRVRLQPDAKFPLRYRDMVGEYFRAIAESEEEK